MISGAASISGFDTVHNTMNAIQDGETAGVILEQSAGIVLGKVKIFKSVISRFKGGPHSISSKPIGDGLDSHHCPAKQCYKRADFSANDGPSIQMDPEDHKLTGSYGNRSSAKAYRARQERLLSEGRLMDAIQTDIDNIREIE